MIKFFYDISGKCKKCNLKFGSLIYKCSKLFLNLVYPIAAFMDTKYGLDDKSEIIISLTSFPQRINTVWITISSLLNQDMKPKKIILWLAAEQFPKEKIPWMLQRLKKRGLEIRFCEDLKPHKKYFYTMMDYPTEVVITADDDILYPEDHISNLWKGYKTYNDCIICSRAHTIKFNGKYFAKYNDWDNTKEQIPGYRVVPIGCNGVLYPPHSLHLETFNKAKLKELALFTDDLWLKCMALLNKTKSVRCYDYDLIYFNLLYCQFGGLWKKNAAGENRNDKVWNDLMCEYPEVIELLKE